MKNILILILEKIFSKLKLTVLTSCKLCVLYMLGTVKSYYWNFPRVLDHDDHDNDNNYCYYYCCCCYTTTTAACRCRLVPMNPMV